MDIKKSKRRLSFILRDNSEIAHQKPINSVVMGNRYISGKSTHLPFCLKTDLFTFSNELIDQTEKET